MEEEDVRGDRGLSVFRLRAVSRLTLVVRCTEIGYSVSTQVLGFRFGCGWCCVVVFLFGCCWFGVLLLCVSAWWNRGIADEVTMASYGRAVTGTAVMARSANEKKKPCIEFLVVKNIIIVVGDVILIVVVQERWLTMQFRRLRRKEGD